MNFSPDDLAQGVVKDRMKVGSSLADVDPMKIDRDVNFSHVGGLETYIRSLKEMILFPLLYPEIFQKFSIQAPRGVLFYGPPGKTSFHMKSLRSITNSILTLRNGQNTRCPLFGKRMQPKRPPRRFFHEERSRLPEQMGGRERTSATSPVRSSN